MLYFVFTVDGDWKGYFKRSLEERSPVSEQMFKLIDIEIDLAKKLLDGKFIHFIHTSPLARDIFLKSEFISKWKKIEEGGGDIGIHPHEEGSYNDNAKMEKTISFFAFELQKEGLNPRAYRGGYMSFNPDITSILEANRIHLEFSCDPGRYLEKPKGTVISDWRGAPDNFYRMDYKDHKKRGKSGVFEIPLGKAGEKSLHFDKHGIFSMRNTAKKLKDKAKRRILSYRSLPILTILKADQNSSRSN